MIPSQEEFGTQVSTPVFSPSPKLDPNPILNKVLSEHPRIAAVHNIKKTKIIFANPNRSMLGQMNGGLLEYWPPNEPGSVDFPHPDPGNTVLEVYNERAKQDPAML